MPRRMRNGARAGVRGGDLLTLAADVVGREPADGAHGRCVVADREVVIAAFLRGAPHLGDARAPVRPGRMAMQVAADVARLDERGRLAVRRFLAQPGGHHARPSAPKAVASSGASGSGSSGATKAGAPVARSSAVPNRSGSAAMSSTGTPSTVSLIARRSSRSMIATICGSAAKRSSTGDGSATAHTTASCSHESRHRRTSPAGSPLESAANPPTRPTPGRAADHAAVRGADPRASASSSRASVLGPTPGTSRSRPPPRRPGTSGVRTPSARAISTDRLAPSPRDSARALPGRGELALQLGQLGDFPVSTSSRSRARSRARSHAARERGRAV